MLDLPHPPPRLCSPHGLLQLKHRRRRLHRRRRCAASEPRLRSAAFAACDACDAAACRRGVEGSLPVRNRNVVLNMSLRWFLSVSCGDMTMCVMRGHEHVFDMCTHGG
jgi:hypothetical protein